MTARDEQLQPAHPDDAHAPGDGSSIGVHKEIEPARLNGSGASVEHGAVPIPLNPQPHAVPSGRTSDGPNAGDGAGGSTVASGDVGSGGGEPAGGWLHVGEPSPVPWDGYPVFTNVIDLDRPNEHTRKATARAVHPQPAAMMRADNERTVTLPKWRTNDLVGVSHLRRLLEHVFGSRRK